jgi:pimeloyl-ACP methyl ester carboxylesterase
MAGAVIRTTLTALALVLAAPAAASAAPHWHPCRGPANAAVCTTMTVPLDRSGALPGSVRLRVGRLPGGTGRPTLMYLSGGPGSAGLEEMTSVADYVPPLQERYRVVGFDQRGTGYSGLLRCPRLERDPRLRSVAAGEDCARRLGAARTHYTTPDSVADMEAIRQALGVERLTLFGISYGTELALAYARAHPDHVERLILDSVVDPDDRDPFGLAGFRAMAPTLAALCPRGCQGLTDDPARDLAELAARLRAKPMRGFDYDARGRRHRRVLGPTALADLMYDADYNPPMRSGVPAAVRAALGGDPAPLLRLVAEGDTVAELPSPRSFSSARYATVCEETPLPWDRGTPLGDRLAVARERAAALGAAAFAPFDLTTAAADEIGLCLHWPDVPSGATPAGSGGYPAVPTLILQGGEDLRTPPEGSARVAAAIPGSERVVVPGVGHGVVGGDPSNCGLRALRRFIAGAAAGGDCPRVATGVPPSIPPPASISRVAPAEGLHGRVGRTAAAVGMTIDDLAFAVSPAFLAYSDGGLRGGSFAVRAGRLVLRRFEAVRGVRLSGRAAGDELHLRVTGPRAARGRVRLTMDGLLRGRLGGRRVAVRLRNLAAASAGAGGAPALGGLLRRSPRRGSPLAAAPR